MTLKAFLFLLVVAIVAVVAAAFIAERVIGPGFERGILIAVLAGLVVFPAARWAEYRGWIKGSWSPGGEMRKAPPDAQENKHQDAGTDRADPRGGDHPSSGESR